MRRNIIDKGVLQLSNYKGAYFGYNVLYGRNQSNSDNAHIYLAGTNNTIEYNYIEQNNYWGSTAPIRVKKSAIISNNYLKYGNYSIQYDTSWASTSTVTVSNNIIQTYGNAVDGPTNGATQRWAIPNLPNGSTVKNNIIFGGGIGGINVTGGNHITVHNNTIDLPINGTYGLATNEDDSTWNTFDNTTASSYNSTMDARNNIVKLGYSTAYGVYDFNNYNDSYTYIDYNIFYGFTGDNYDSSVKSASKTLGVDNGFAANDPVGDTVTKQDPKFVNSSFSPSITPAQIAAGTYTIQQALDEVRNAYKLQATSPAINSGDPANNGDSDVSDGNRDIGALEY